MTAIKRQDWLRNFSREHHYALLLCWKIRKGIDKKIVSAERIKLYAEWFYAENLLPHFRLEENFLFPILDSDETVLATVLAQHNELNELFLSKEVSYSNLRQIADKLETHIRFEERVVFELIQNKANDDQIELIASKHDHIAFEDKLSDIFWD